MYALGRVAKLLVAHGMPKRAGSPAEYPLCAAFCQFRSGVDARRQNRGDCYRKSTIAIAAFACDGTHNQTVRVLLSRKLTGYG